MKEFNGTKGDWIYNKGSREIGIVCNDDDQSHGMIIPVAWVEHCIDNQEEVANAKLISASKDLLFALQFAIPWLPSHDDELMHLVNNAIRKALD